jgi:DNA modification methylase
MDEPIKEYELKKIPVNRIIYDKENPNKLNKSGMRALKQSIKQFGYLVPVIVDEDYIVADGEHRVQAYRELGMREIPVMIIPKNELNRKLIRQVMNKLKGQHNPDLDAAEYAKILDMGGEETLRALLDPVDPKLANVIQRMKDKSNKVKEDEFTEADIKEAPQRVKFGEIWKLGRHKLAVGDSLNPVIRKDLMDGEQADMVFIDPPYNLAFSGTEGKFEEFENDNIDQEAYKEFAANITKALIDTAKEGASYYVCIDFRNYPVWADTIRDHGLELINCIVWDKVFGGMGYRYRLRHEFIIFAGHRPKIQWYGDANQEDVIKLTRQEALGGHHELDMGGVSLKLSDQRYLRIKIEDNKPARITELDPTEKEYHLRAETSKNSNVWEGFSMNYFSQREQEQAEGIVHPTMKPIRLIAQAIMNSTQPTELITDFTAGSGSTLIAAEQTNRRCNAVEIDTKYANVIIHRWEKLTGQKAEKIQESK